MLDLQASYRTMPAENAVCILPFPVNFKVCIKCQSCVNICALGKVHGNENKEEIEIINYSQQTGGLMQAPVFQNRPAAEGNQIKAKRLRPLKIISLIETI